MASGKTIRVSDETHAALVKLAERGFRSIAGTIEWMLGRVRLKDITEESVPSEPPTEKP